MINIISDPLSDGPSSDGPTDTRSYGLWNFNLSAGTNFFHFMLIGGRHFLTLVTNSWYNCCLFLNSASLQLNYSQFAAYRERKTLLFKRTRIGAFGMCVLIIFLAWLQEWLPMKNRRFWNTGMSSAHRVAPGIPTRNIGSSCKYSGIQNVVWNLSTSISEGSTPN